MELTETQKAILKGKICPYCKAHTSFVDSEIIYGVSYGMIYLCERCRAYCGVHKGTDISLGRLANEELREWKQKAHKSFDPIWKSKRLRRREAYTLLAGYLNLPEEYCHIGMFSVQTCKKVIEWSDNFMKQ